MSDDLYRNAMWFDGRRGLAKSDGVSVELDHIPAISALPKNTTEVYVYPMVRDYRLRELAGAMREMYPPEIENVMTFLARIAQFGRTLLNLPAPPTQERIAK